MLLSKPKENRQPRPYGQTMLTGKIAIRILCKAIRVSMISNIRSNNGRVPRFQN